MLQRRSDSSNGSFSCLSWIANGMRKKTFSERTRKKKKKEEERRLERTLQPGVCFRAAVSVVMRLAAKRSQTQTVADSLLNIITGLHPGAEALAESFKRGAVREH